MEPVKRAGAVNATASLHPLLNASPGLALACSAHRRTKYQKENQKKFFLKESEEGGREQ
jgi:hypothetical protein